MMLMNYHEESDGGFFLLLLLLLLLPAKDDDDDDDPSSSPGGIVVSLPVSSIYVFFAFVATKNANASRNRVSRSCKLSLIVTSENSVVSYSCNKFCRCSVKQLGKKSGKNRCIAPKTKTWPTGERGMIRIMTTGMKVIISLKVRLCEAELKKNGRMKKEEVRKDRQANRPFKATI